MRCAMLRFFVHGLLLVTTSWIQIHFEERRREGKNSRKIYGKKWKRGKIEQTMVAPQLLCYSRPPFKTRQQRILVGAEKEEALNKRKRHCIFFYIETTDVCKGQFIDWYSPWCVIRNCETNKASSLFRNWFNPFKFKFNFKQNISMRSYRSLPWITCRSAKIH